MKSKEFVAEIKQLSLEELTERSRSAAQELMKLRFRKASGQLEQSHLLKEVRRNLARLQGEIANRRKQDGQGLAA